MASSTTLLLFSLALLLYLLPLLSSADQLHSVTKAADVLADSGHIAMSLTLHLLTGTSIFNASFSTIFSPSDDAFSLSGQPSISLLQLHFSPVAYSFEELQFLPFGSKIPTLSPARSLTVTTLSTNTNNVLIDNVKVDGSPIYDDGNLIVFGIDQFFHFDIKVSRSSPSPSPEIVLNIPTPTPSPKIPPRPSPSIEIPPPSPVTTSNFECPVFSGDRMFTEAGKRMRSEGFSIMASFLDMQLAQFDDADTPLTVFAPLDEALKGRIGNYTAWGSLFLEHVVPCDVSLTDLAVSEDGAVLSSFMEGVWINVTRSGDLLLLNGVPVVFPDLYHGDRVIVHGIQDVLVVTRRSSDDEGGDGEGFVVNEF